MHLIILGAPGSGKGTQAAQIVRWLHIEHLSTGEMLRLAILSDTPLGRSIKPIVESGGLVSDEVVSTVVIQRVADLRTERGYILDGFPRTIEQAIILNAGLAKIGQTIDHVIQLVTSPAALLERIVRRADEARAMGMQPRADDNPTIFESRLDTYMKTTAPVADYYRAAGKLRPIDGMQDPASVSRDILRKLATKVGS